MLMFRTGSDTPAISSAPIAICFPGLFLRGTNGVKRPLSTILGRQLKADAFVHTSTMQYEDTHSGDCESRVDSRAVCDSLRGVGFSVRP
eukprot:6196292-Pleurochrysis_carterae.AAC.2